MYIRLLFLGVLFSIVFLCAAACDDDDDENVESASCPIGSEGCSCTFGGGCRDNLKCISKKCVNLNPPPDSNSDTDIDSDADTDSDTDPDTDTIPIGIDTSTELSCNDSPCDKNATCDDSDGKIVCTCNLGYTGDGTNCTDEDECQKGKDRCDRKNGACSNTEGSYACTCNTGFELNADEHTCDDVDECSDGTHNCDTENGICNNNLGGFTCACKGGYIGDGLTCTEVICAAATEQQPCSCGNNASGYQVCNSEGTGWDDCYCDCVKDGGYDCYTDCSSSFLSDKSSYSCSGGEACCDLTGAMGKFCHSLVYTSGDDVVLCLIIGNPGVELCANTGECSACTPIQASDQVNFTILDGSTPVHSGYYLPDIVAGKSYGIVASMPESEIEVYREDLTNQGKQCSDWYPSSK